MKYLLLSFFLFSCGLFDGPDKPVKLKLKKPQICHLQNSYVFLGEDLELSQFFKTQMPKWKFNKKELIYAWTLANSIVRPDVINDESFGGVFLIDKLGEISVVDNQYFKNINKQRVLKKLNKDLPKKLKINRSFSEKLSFLFAKNQKIPNRYKVANQTLSKDEVFTTKKLKPSRLFNTHKISPKIIPTPSENSSCLSFENNHHSQSSLSVLGVYSDNWKAIIVHSNQFQAPFHSPTPVAPPISICGIKTTRSSNVYFSFDNRKHLELIQNMLKLEVESINNIEDLMYYINYPRFYIDKKSKYIKIESLRTDKTLENYLNSLNIPIYHENHLGKIHSFYQFKANKQSGIMLDPRDPLKNYCLSE